MSMFPQEFIVHNQAELEDLAWEIETSAGQFSLILARCNYATLRQQLVEALRQLCAVELRVLMLNPTETVLYARIQAELGETPPGALLVFGLETVDQLEHLLSNANQVREEFRKHCPFPIVLWVTDDVQRLLINAAPDLESWATKTHFTLPPQALNQGLQQASDRLFSALLNPNRQPSDTPSLDFNLGLFNPSEVTAAVQELRSQQQVLDPALQASLDFLQGLHLQAADPEAALEHFEQSLRFWQQQGTRPLAAHSTDLALRQGLLLFYSAQAHYAIASAETQAPNWAGVRRSLQTAIATFEQASRPDLVVLCVPLLERVLQKQSDWTQLETVARQGITLHQVYGTPTRRSQDYGFLAKVAIEQAQWSTAKAAAQQALVELAKEPEDRLWLRGLYLLFLAQAERQLGEPEAAMAHLIDADAGGVSDRGYPKFAIRILAALRELYFERHQYLDAFHAKQEIASIQQQYGILAFVGAGRLQPQRQKAVTEFQTPAESRVAPEIAAAGRQQDLNRLMERIGRRDYRLIVIHGNSGVGKSSLVSAGLVPSLKQRAIDVRDNLPVVMRTYSQWMQELEQRLDQEAGGRAGWPLSDAGAVATADGLLENRLLEKLQWLDQRHLRTVLIFDQFEEFFFAYPQPEQRQPFFDFLTQCLQILSLNVVLSLRQDYLHLLLEFNRLPAMAATGIDVLSKNVLYELGNFSPEDAKTVIQSLTECVRFRLEPALVEQLVADLAREAGTVRPIELQLVGAQLQAENITTLVQYRACGQEPKQELVQRYLDGVVANCGTEHRPLAELVLYLLTDEKGTRPLKTRAELEKELLALAVTLDAANPSLDLVLQIFVESGLVFLLPELPADRYQLVHDYIATFIRQQQAPQLEKLLADLDTERQHRQQAEQALAMLEAQKQTAEVELYALKAEQDRAQHALVAITQKVKRRSLLGVAALALAVVAGSAAAFSLVGVTEARRQARSADANLKAAKAQIRQVDTDAENRQRDAENKVKVANQQAQNAQAKQREADTKAQRANQDVARAKADLARIGARSAQQIRAAQVELQQAEVRVAQATQEQAIAAKQVQDANLLLSTAQRAQALAVAGTSLERAGVSAIRQFEFQQTEALLAATRAGQQLKTLVQTNQIQTLSDYPAFSPLLALQTSLDTLRETRLEGHQGGVSQVAFSPDGKRLATNGFDGTARLWDLQGQQIAKLEGSQGNVLQDITFSPDGQRLATSKDDGIVQVWNLQGQQLAKLEGHQGGVYQVTFSPDGQRLATSGGDGTARVWNLQGRQLAKLEGHQGVVWRVAFSPGGQRLATSGGDGTARVWNLQGQQLAKLEGHQGVVWQVAFSPDGQRLVTNGDDGTARVWNLQGQQLAKLEGHQGKIYEVTFSPDGQRLATSGDDGTARVWNLQGQQIAKLEGHQSAVFHVAFSPNGQRLATSGDDGTVRLWDLQGQQIAKLEGHQTRFDQVTFSPDGQRLALLEDDGTARLWDLQGEHVAELEGYQGEVYEVRFSPNSQRLVTSGYDGTVRLWNLQGEEMATLEGYQGGVYEVRFSPDGQRLATSRDRTAWVWTLQGEQVAELGGYQGDVYDVTFSPDGQRLATSGVNGTARLWNLQGEEMATLKGHQGIVTQVTFSPDGQRLATRGVDGTVRVWTLQGEQVAELRGHQGIVYDVTFSPDGQRLATSGDDGTARVWTLQGEQVAELKGHQGIVTQVTFSPDGQRLATSGEDKTVRLWNLQGEQVAELKGHQGGVTQVSFSPDGQRLATRGEDRTVRLWNLQGQQVAQFEGRGVLSPDWSRIALIQPSNPLLSDATDWVVTLWRVDDLNGLLARACDRLHWYLTYSRSVTESDRAMCGIQATTEATGQNGDR